MANLIVPRAYRNKPLCLLWGSPLCLSVHEHYALCCMVAIIVFSEETHPGKNVIILFPQFPLPYATPFSRKDRKSNHTVSHLSSLTEAVAFQRQTD